MTTPTKHNHDPAPTPEVSYGFTGCVCVCVGEGEEVYMDIPRYKVFKLFDIYMYGLLAMYKKRVLKSPNYYLGF